MLETLKPLIGKLCSGTSVTPESFENGYAFSSYNTDFFAVWTIEDRFCFSWSERHPSTAFCIDTQSATIASYIVIAAVGALRRADLFQDAISPAILTDELRSRWVSSPTRWPRVVNYQHIENPQLSLNSRSSPVEWCNRFVSFGLGYALSWSGVSSCWVGCGVSRDLVRMSRLR